MFMQTWENVGIYNRLDLRCGACSDVGDCPTSLLPNGLFVVRFGEKIVEKGEGLLINNTLSLLIGATNNVAYASEHRRQDRSSGSRQKRNKLWNDP